MKDKFKTERYFLAEFLREGQALKDNLHPSRIIMGSDLEQVHIFAGLLCNAAEKEDIETLFMRSISRGGEAFCQYLSRHAGIFFQ